MLDANIATDYMKVKKVFNIQQREQEFIPVLKELTTEGVLKAYMTDFFNLERKFYESDLISLLFYMGWLTIQSESEGRFIFKMPNRVIRELYYNYFIDVVEQESGLNRTVNKIQDALDKLSQNNNPHPLLELIKTLIDKDLSLRDVQKFDERHLKMLLIPYLSMSASHYVVSEPEWENGYPDILFLKRPNVTTRHNFILELKYVKKSDANKSGLSADGVKEKIIALAEREAHSQLDRYLRTDNAKRLTNLKAWMLVLVGREWKVVKEMQIG